MVVMRIYVSIKLKCNYVVKLFKADKLIRNYTLIKIMLSFSFDPKD